MISNLVERKIPLSIGFCSVFMYVSLIYLSFTHCGRTRWQAWSESFFTCVKILPFRLGVGRRNWKKILVTGLALSSWWGS